MYPTAAVEESALEHVAPEQTAAERAGAGGVPPRVSVASPRLLAGETGPRLLFWAMPFVVLGLTAYLLGVVIAVPRGMLFDSPTLHALNEKLVWYSGVPVFVGFVLCLADLLGLLPSKRDRQGVMNVPVPPDARVTVTLTAYDDEQSIGAAVRDFLAHPRVERVVVVDNASHDRTAEVARAAGAQVVVETRPGYGRCVARCLLEGASFEDTDLVVLCEGDMTFRAADIDKLLAYAPHATIVNGTRIVEQLREYDTQLSTFMYYGNFAVGKLLEVKHLGRGTFTDVGTTYKLLRRDAVLRMLRHVDPAVNLEFNAHFLDRALAHGERLVECAITFYPRVGVSKGGNVDNLRALKVGLRMIVGLYTDWRWNAE